MIGRLQLWWRGWDILVGSSGCTLATLAACGGRHPPGNRLEALKGNRKGQHSIRINRQYRVCFRWTQPGPEDVEIVDYHA